MIVAALENSVSIFPFSNNVFNRPLFKGHLKSGLSSKSLKKRSGYNMIGNQRKSLLTIMLLNAFPNKSWFLRVCITSLLKTLWVKEKLLVTSNFSFSQSVFYPFGEHSAIFIKFEIVVCKLFQFGRV